METSAQTSPASSASARMPVGKVLFRGKVDSFRVHEGSHYTEILTPAEDEYSRPQVIEIRSKRRLGRPGEVIEVLCRAGGYRGNLFTYTDKETGEQLKSRKVLHTFDLIE